MTKIGKIWYRIWPSLIVAGVVSFFLFPEWWLRQFSLPPLSWVLSALKYTFVGGYTLLWGGLAAAAVLVAALIVGTHLRVLMTWSRQDTRARSETVNFFMGSAGLALKAAGIALAIFIVWTIYTKAIEDEPIEDVNWLAIPSDMLREACAEVVWCEIKEGY